MIKVKSSNIAAIGFNKEKRLTLSSPPISVLRIQFTSGAVYDYYKVPEEVFEEFTKAKSVGGFFHKNIKDKYQFEVVQKKSKEEF